MTTAFTRAAATAALLCAALATAPAASAQSRHVPPAASTPHTHPAQDDTDDGDSPFEPITEVAEDLADSILGEGNPISENVIDGGADEILDGVFGGTN